MGRWRGKIEVGRKGRRDKGEGWKLEGIPVKGTRKHKVKSKRCGMSRDLCGIVRLQYKIQGRQHQEMKSGKQAELWTSDRLVWS